MPSCTGPAATGSLVDDGLSRNGTFRQRRTGQRPSPPVRRRTSCARRHLLRLPRRRGAATSAADDGRHPGGPPSPSRLSPTQRGRSSRRCAGRTSRRRPRDAGLQPGVAAELFLSVDAVKTHLRSAVPRVPHRGPAAEPEALGPGGGRALGLRRRDPRGANEERRGSGPVHPEGGWAPRPPIQEDNRPVQPCRRTPTCAYRFATPLTDASPRRSVPRCSRPELWGLPGSAPCVRADLPMPRWCGGGPGQGDRRLAVDGGPARRSAQPPPARRRSQPPHLRRRRSSPRRSSSRRRTASPTRPGS